MKVESIGQNIRKFRKQKKLRQEDLAEMTGLSPNYVGALERGEKIPSLETFIDIINALTVSADMVLCDVIDQGYEIKSSLIGDQIRRLSREDQERIYDVVSVLIQHSKPKNI